jgi:thiol-disulfide isomerase/thioredoxin
MKRTKKVLLLETQMRVSNVSGSKVRGLLTVAIMLLGCTFTQLSSAEELQEYTEKKTTPPLELMDMHGNPHSLADYSGKVVLVNFWAGWCHPCIQEIPELIKLAEIFKDRPFTILAVNVAEEKKVARYGFVKKMDEHMVMLIDSDSKAFERWKGIGLPSTFVLDPAGVIRYEANGPVNWDREDV